MRKRVFGKKKLDEQRDESACNEIEEFFEVQTEFPVHFFKEHSSKQRILRRTEIPPKPSNSSLKAAVKILSKCVGKDLTRMPIPATFWSEPLSFLQRLSECLEYSSLLDKAAECKSDLDQMAHVAAFSMSFYSQMAERVAKPFNPLLNETFEFDRLDDLGWRSLSEQVGHHPPKMAHVTLFFF